MAGSTCEVSLGDYDGDEATFYHEREVTAAKPHACYECHEAIQKGERHHVVAGKWEGEVRTYRFCAPCWEISGEFSEHGRTFGVVWDAFETEWGGGATLQGCLNRLSSVSAKEHMTRQWRKWKQLP